MIELQEKNSKLQLDAGFTGYVALKGFFKITDDWGLSNAEQRVLLGGLPDQTYYKYKKLPRVKLNKDLLERISYVMGIRKALSILFPTKEQSDAWVRKENKDFGDSSALNTMLCGSISDLYRVRRYLDAYRG
jgi:hypothetical protein